MSKKNENFLTQSIGVTVLALLCCLLWGSASPLIKTGYRLFQIPAESTASVIMFAGLRFTLAGLMTIAAGSVLAHRVLIPKRTSWGMTGILAVFQTILQYLFFYIGLAYATGSKGAIYSGTATFFSILISSLIFRQEKLTARKMAGCVIGFIGILILNAKGGAQAAAFVLAGDGALLLSNIANGVSASLIKKFSAREDPVVLSGWQFTAGGIVMMLTGLCCGGRLHPVNAAAWLLIVYLGFVSAAAYTVWGLLLKYNPVSKITSFSFATPIFGVILSVIILNEKIDVGKSLAALACVCAGICIVNGVKLLKKHETAGKS